MIKHLIPTYIYIRIHVNYSRCQKRRMHSSQNKPGAKVSVGKNTTQGTIVQNPPGMRRPLANNLANDLVNNRQQFIDLAVCLTTGPKPLPKRALHILRSKASSFK
jgi:hypothetical protein